MKKKIPWFNIGVIVFIVAIVATFIIINKMPEWSNSGSYISDDYKAGLFAFAKEMVSSHLKSPTTAKYPLYTQCSFQKGEDNVYMITGYVDSQNGFGATVREQWGCMIQEIGSKWKMVMVQIGDNYYYD